MFNKFNWNKQIYKNDLITVIVFGLATAILGGILAGFLDAFILSISSDLGLGLNISFSILVLALLVGFAVKKGYESYHILYSVLALVFFFIGLFFSYVFEFVALLAINKQINGGGEFFRFLGIILSRGDTYYSFFFPINTLINDFTVAKLFYFIINIAFLAVGFLGVYRISIDRNKID